MKSSRLFAVLVVVLLTACTSDATPTTTTSLPPDASGTSVVDVPSASVISPSGNPPTTPVPPQELGSMGKIEAGEKAGTIDHDTALVYELYAALDYGSLPNEYQSDNSAADPEGTSILAELRERFDQLSTDLKAKVEPFFRRPTDPASFWAKRMAAQTPPKNAASLVSALSIDAITYEWADAEKTPVRVWYATPRGDSEKQLARKLADEIDSSDMWNLESKAMLGHTPCSDGEYPSPGNGYNGSLDVYLIYPATGLDWHGRVTSLRLPSGRFANGITIPENLGLRGCPWVSYIALNAELPFDHLKNAMAHELFHSFEFSFKNSTSPNRSWWAEASATWATDLVYPELNYEQPYLEPYWSKAPGSDGPLDSTTDLAAYGAYIWPFYLRQQAGGDATVVGQLWQASESKASIDAMHDLAGWNNEFKELALWNWNKEPVIKYKDGLLPISNVMLAQDTTCIAGSKPDCAISAGKRDIFIGLSHASAQYFQGTTDVDVEQLHFDLKGLKGKPGVGVQAIISYANAGQPGVARVEDWSGLDKRDFCMAREYVDKIVLIVTNSNISAADTLAGKIGVEATKDKCGGGVATMTETEAWAYTTNFTCGVNTRVNGSARLSMVVQFDEDRTGTATVSSHRTETTATIPNSGTCGFQPPPESSLTETSTDGAGTVDAVIEWDVSPDGTLTFQADWSDNISAVSTSSSSCAPTPCDATRSEDTVLQWLELYFDAKVDPKQQVFVGSKTEDASQDGKQDVTVYTWSLGR